MARELDLQIEIGQLPEYLSLEEYILRTADATDAFNSANQDILCMDKPGPHFQAVVLNRSRTPVKIVDFHCSYYSDTDAFLGLDKPQYVMLAERLFPQERYALDLKLMIPRSVRKIVFSLRARRIRFAERFLERYLP